MKNILCFSNIFWKKDQTFEFVFPGLLSCETSQLCIVNTNTVYLVTGLPEVRVHLVNLLVDDVAQLLPGELSQDTLWLVKEDAAGQQALVDGVEEGQPGLEHMTTNAV